MSWFWQYSLKWAEAHFVLLSDTIVSGRPWVAIMLSSTLIVGDALVDNTVITFEHSECEFTRTRWLAKSMPPSKSTCSRLHEFFVFGQGIRFSVAGPFLDTLWLTLLYLCPCPAIERNHILLISFSLFPDDYSENVCKMVRLQVSP